MPKISRKTPPAPRNGQVQAAVIDHVAQVALRQVGQRWLLTVQSATYLAPQEEVRCGSAMVGTGLE